MHVDNNASIRTQKSSTSRRTGLFEWFVTDGNEKADKLAKAGPTLDGGFMAEARAKTVQQEREKVYAALQYAASFQCLGGRMEGEDLKPKPKEKRIFVDQK